jgi:hypothetical protein
VRESPFGRDIVREFVDAARAAGIKPGLYYIINQNYFLSFSGGKIVPRTAPGQQHVTEADYEAIVLAQLRELWTAYGSLVELWFDGGCPPSLKDKVAALLEELQPESVRFQGEFTLRLQLYSLALQPLSPLSNCSLSSSSRPVELTSRPLGRQ